MTIVSAQTEIPHGVVFIYDPSMVVDVPDDTSAASILSTENCISIWTIGEYDGEVLLTMSDEETGNGKNPSFEGYIITKGKMLAFMTSSCDEIISIDTNNIKSFIKIFVNPPDYPNVVRCLLITE